MLRVVYILDVLEDLGGGGKVHGSGLGPQGSRVSDLGATVQGLRSVFRDLGLKISGLECMGSW